MFRIFYSFYCFSIFCIIFAALDGLVCVGDGLDVVGNGWDVMGLLVLLLPVKPPRGAVDREFVIYRIGDGGGGRRRRRRAAAAAGGGGGGRHQHHHQHQLPECLPGTRAQNGFVASAGAGAGAGVLLQSTSVLLVHLCQSAI